MTNRLSLLLLALVTSVAHAQPPANDAVPGFQFVQRPDANVLAEKYAAYIKEDPSCDKFRVQLAKLAEGSPYDNRTTPQMTATLQRAKMSGCHK